MVGSRDIEKREKSPGTAEAKTPVIRKGLEVDKFGFYHAQPIQAAPSSSSSAYENSESAYFFPLFDLTGFFQDLIFV